MKPLGLGAARWADVCLADSALPTGGPHKAGRAGAGREGRPGPGAALSPALQSGSDPWPLPSPGSISHEVRTCVGARKGPGGDPGCGNSTVSISAALTWVTAGGGLGAAGHWEGAPTCFGVTPSRDPELLRLLSALCLLEPLPQPSTGTVWNWGHVAMTEGRGQGGPICRGPCRTGPSGSWLRSGPLPRAWPAWLPRPLAGGRLGPTAWSGYGGFLTGIPASGPAVSPSDPLSPHGLPQESPGSWAE